MTDTPQPKPSFPLLEAYQSLAQEDELQGNAALEAALRNASLLELSDMISVDSHFDRDLKFIYKNIRFSIDIDQCLMLRQVRGLRWEFKIVINKHKFVKDSPWISIPPDQHNSLETAIRVKQEASNVTSIIKDDDCKHVFQQLGEEKSHFESFRYERGGVLFSPSADSYNQFDKAYLSNVASIISFCVEKDASNRFLSDVYQNLRNISEQARHQPEQSATHSIPTAYIEESSGLPNQTGFLRLLNHIIDSQQPHFSLVVLSIDKFAYFCNLFDEQTKSQFLTATIERIQSIICQNATLSHIGPTDLAFVMLEKDQDVVNQKVLEIINLFSEDLQVDDIKVRFEICAGFTSYPSCSDKAEMLLKMANIALFRATQRNSNRLVAYRPGMEKELKLHLELGRSIRQAVERNEFEVYFQPIARGDDIGKPVHFEALIRWLHPEQGLISPVLFIEIAEASGDIVPLGYWVVERVCEHLCRPEVPSDTRIAINLSPVQLREHKLAKQMQSILQRYGIAPTRITFEITETAAMLDTALTKQRFAELHDIGFKLSVDDFGTGHSSLSYLINFSFDYLKIDKSFIDHTALDEGYAVIANGIVEIAHKLNMSVICEGIETKQQLAMVNDWGTDLVQGYLMSRPLPMEHFYPSENQTQGSACC